MQHRTTQGTERRDLSPALKRDNCLRNKVRPHRDLGGEEGSIPVPVPGPPGATGLENHVPGHRPVHLTGQRADGDMAYHKSVRLWMTCVSLGAEGLCRGGNRGGSISGLWCSLPHCNEWVTPTPPVPPRPGSTTLVSRAPPQLPLPFHSHLDSLDSSPPGAWLCHLHLLCTRTNSLVWCRTPSAAPQGVLSSSTAHMAGWWPKGHSGQAPA